MTSKSHTAPGAPASRFRGWVLASLPAAQYLNLRTMLDTLNRLTTLTPPSAFTSGSFSFGYDALSRRTQLTRPNSVNTAYSYDNLSRLTSVLHQLSGSTIDGAGYTLDNSGNRTAKVDHLANVTSNYGYDAIYELTGVTQGTTRQCITAIRCPLDFHTGELVVWVSHGRAGSEQ